MLNANQIKPHMPVVCSNNGQFAIVDHMQGPDTIKLARDDKGVHHYIPLSWVSSVDDKIHIDRPGDQAMREWKTSPPVTAGDDAKRSTDTAKPMPATATSAKPTPPATKPTPPAAKPTPQSTSRR